MPATEQHREDGQQFLSFFFAGEEYATEILRIREVVEYQRLTPVPTTPPWVRGVMNLRGTVVPVLDLAIKLQQRETAVEKLTCIVIFEVDLDGDRTPVGVMIDQVGRVFELRGDEIQEPPPFGSPVRPELLEGIGMVEDKPVPILHIQKVLTEDELAVAVAGAEAIEDEPEVATEPKRKETKGQGATAGETAKKQSHDKKKAKPKSNAKGKPKRVKAATRPEADPPKPAARRKGTTKPTEPEAAGSPGGSGGEPGAGGDAQHPAGD